MTPTADVLCCGIIVAEHVCSPISHVPAAGELVMADKMLLTIGGCAANAAVDLVKMEVTAAVVGRVGGDVFGRVVADMLRGHGVDVTGLKVTPECDTSQTLIVNVPGQDRRFVHTFMPRAADIPPEVASPRSSTLPATWSVQAHPGRPDPGFPTARRTGAKPVLDGRARQGEHLKAGRGLPHVDVFLPNTDEAKLMTGEADTVKQAELFHRLGAKTAVITMGGDGAVLVNDHVRLKSGAYPVEYVDGSGGGDAFDAGFIYGLLHDLDIEDCLRMASALGASCVRAIGTTPGVFTRSACEAFMRAHTLKIESL